MTTPEALTAAAQAAGLTQEEIGKALELIKSDEVKKELKSNGEEALEINVCILW